VLKPDQEVAMELRPRGISLSLASISRRRVVVWSCVTALVVGSGFVARGRVLEFAEDLSPTPAVMTGEAGTLFLVGGGALPDSLGREFVELAGGPTARLVIIPGAATDDSKRSAEIQTWRALGVTNVSVLHADSRSQADNPDFSKSLTTATGVWLGGGQQTWFTAWYRGTLVEDRLKEVLERGGVIGGTSAGASAVTSVMVAGGKREPIESRGLGLLDGVIVDQHFLRRNRTGRMLKLLSRHPDQIGLGIDEATAVVVDLKSGNIAVRGQSYVLACVPDSDGVLQRLEVLKSGDYTSLADLRDHAAEPVPAIVGDLILGD
jgi:cyanophycinase